MLYWPTAIVREENGTICSMYATTGLETCEKAKAYFDFLKKDYNEEILFSYIQDNDNKIVEMNDYTEPYSPYVSLPEEKEDGRYYFFFILRNKEGKVWSMFSIRGLRHLLYTKETIDIYKTHDDVDVLLAYITDGDKIVFFENNLDAFGKVHYDNQEISNTK